MLQDAYSRSHSSISSRSSYIIGSDFQPEKNQSLAQSVAFMVIHIIPCCLMFASTYDEFPSTGRSESTVEAVRWVLLFVGLILPALTWAMWLLGASSLIRDAITSVVAIGSSLFFMFAFNDVLFILPAVAYPATGQQPQRQLWSTVAAAASFIAVIVAAVMDPLDGAAATRPAALSAHPITLTAKVALLGGCLARVAFTLQGSSDVQPPRYTRRTPADSRGSHSHGEPLHENGPIVVSSNPIGASNPLSSPKNLSRSPLTISLAQDMMELESIETLSRMNDSTTTLSPIQISSPGSPRESNGSLSASISSHSAPWGAPTVVEGASFHRRTASGASVNSIPRPAPRKATVHAKPAKRAVTLLVLRINRNESDDVAARPHSLDTRSTYEMVLNRAYDRIVVENNAMQLPHVDSNALVFAWGVGTSHPEPCRIAVQCAMALRTLCHSPSATLSAAVVHKRTHCGVFQPGQTTPSANPTHFHLMGSLVTDTLNLAQYAGSINSACVVNDGCVHRIGDYYVSRPVRSGQLDGSDISVHEVLMPLPKPAGQQSTEWHIQHERRESYVKDHENFIAALEAYQAGQLDVAEVMLGVHLEGYPNDGAALELRQKILHPEEDDRDVNGK